jgi:hypothetical protein
MSEQRHVGDLIGYATGIGPGSAVYCVECAAELFPDSRGFGAVRRDWYTEREVHALLQGERPAAREEPCAECGAVVISTEPPLPRPEEPDSWVV